MRLSHPRDYYNHKLYAAYCVVIGEQEGLLRPDEQRYRQYQELAPLLQQP
jgi:hypothetical protein